MRFDDRVTGRVDRFARQAQVIHVDIDKSEFNKIIPAQATIHADLRSALEALIDGFGAKPRLASMIGQRKRHRHGGPLPRDRAMPGMMSATDVLDRLF